MFSYPVNRPARRRTCCRTCELRAAAPAPRLRLQHRAAAPAPRCGSSRWKRMLCTAVNQRPATAGSGEGQRDLVPRGDGPRARGSKRGSPGAAGAAAAVGALCSAQLPRAHTGSALPAQEHNAQT